MSDDLPTGHVNDQDLAIGAAPPQMGLQWATVGWDDKAEVVDIGSSSNDGVTFVFITTYAGRTPGDPPKPGVAQGHKYIAQILGPFWRIPKKGERVLVGFPSGMETTTGAAVILGTLGASPGTQFSPTRVKLDFGADTDVVIKGRSVTCSDYGNQFIVVGPDSGIIGNDSTGSGFAVKGGNVGMWSSAGGSMATCLQLTASEASLVVNGGSLLKLEPTKATLFGLSVYCTGGAVYLGKAPTPANTAVWGVSGPAAVATPGVFISPV